MRKIIRNGAAAPKNKSPAPIAIIPFGPKRNIVFTYITSTPPCDRGQLQIRAAHSHRIRRG